MSRGEAFVTVPQGFVHSCQTNASPLQWHRPLACA
jgi:hypothetical protein